MCTSGCRPSTGVAACPLRGCCGLSTAAHDVFVRKQGQSADLRLPQQRLSWAGTGGDGEIWTVVSCCSVPVSLVSALTRHLTIGKRHALLISDDVRRYQGSSVRS